MGLRLCSPRIGAELAAAENAEHGYRIPTEIATRVVPGTQLASITQLRGDGTFATAVASDPAVDAVDQIQYDLDSGPCVDATAEGGAFPVHDLRIDPRWPEFGRRAFKSAGMVSMFSI